MASATAGHVSTDDNEPMTVRETFEAYKQDPDRDKFREERRTTMRERRQERKALKRRVKEEEAQLGLAAREEVKKRGEENDNLRAEMEHMRKPYSDDWLVHNGNVNYSRDRNLFYEYYPIEGTAVTADTRRTVTVLGIGKVEIELKPGWECFRSSNVLRTTVLHVPAARCNGLSLHALNRQGLDIAVRSGFKRGENSNSEQLGVYDIKGKRPIFCINESGGQVRACRPREPDGVQDGKHIIEGTVDISCDRESLAKLAPEAGLHPQYDKVIAKPD